MSSTVTPVAPTARVEPATASFRLRYWPALDGLRGLAILAVLGFHARYGFADLDHGLFQGGYVGVDVFFVLSGFLITTILLGGREADERLDLPRFLGRRILRLVPALLFLAVAAFIAAIAVLGADLRSLTFEQIPQTLGYFMNWVEANRAVPRPGLFSHTWSLAVEGQFYVAWAVLLLLLRKAGLANRALFVVALAGVEACSAWRAILYRQGALFERTYFGLDTRVDGLLMGAALALALLSWGVPVSTEGRRAAQGVGVAGLAGILAIVFGVGRRAPFLYESGGLTVAALAASGLIFSLVVAPRGLLASFFRWRPLVAVGKISYSLYLWHWPIYLLTAGDRTHWSFTTAMVVRLSSSVLLATTSYFLVERPVLRLKDRKPDETPAPAVVEAGVRGAQVPSVH